MPETSAAPNSAMDPRVKNIQPGGGVVMSLELLWGGVRRWYLKTFRKAYLAEMKVKRRGQHNQTPHEVLDPRDLKFYRNQPGYYWEPEDDPFAWRETLPFARVGLAELFVFSVMFFAPAIGLSIWLANRPGVDATAIIGWLGVTTLVVCGLLIVWFFRDPNRNIPADPGGIISPADGKVVAIYEVEHDDDIDGPALVIGIFLSIFNVHLNRSPSAGVVERITYEPGKMLNALRPESAKENERLSILLRSTEGETERRMVVRQITGAIARRIVCWLKPGDELERGERVGMIKLGSRTELVLPRDPNLTIRCQLGQSVKGGADLLAVYESEAAPE